MIHAMIFNKDSEELMSGIFESKELAQKAVNSNSEADYYVVCPGCEKCIPILKPIKRLDNASKLLITSGIIFLILALISFVMS